MHRTVYLWNFEGNLDEYYFGYEETAVEENKVVEAVECMGMRCSITCDGNYIVCYPTEVDYLNYPDFIKLDPDEIDNLKMSTFFRKYFEACFGPDAEEEETVLYI